MKDDIKRFRFIDKLKISGVPDIVIYDYVKDFENKLNNEYEIHMSKNEFEKALGKLAWSFILPYSSNDKYSIITKALHTFEYIDKYPDGIFDINEIKDEIFENFKIILKKEWEIHLWENKIKKFDLLDNEDILLDKKFDELLEILNDDKSPYKNDNLSVINDIRLHREKYASELLSIYFSKSKELLNPRNENETDKEILKEELINLEKQILQYSSGRYSKYAQNQMNYYTNIKEMTDNENYQVEISEQTEKIIRPIKNNLLEFENEINSDKNTLKDKILIIISVFEEAKENNCIDNKIKIIENWAENIFKNNIINQIENDTREMSDKKSYIKEIIELIDSYNKILPDAIKLKLHHKLTDIIKQDNNEFIDNTKQEDIPIIVEKELPKKSIIHSFLQWIKYFFKKIFRK